MSYGRPINLKWNYIEEEFDKFLWQAIIFILIVSQYENVF